jgi:hypothetical protein
VSLIAHDICFRQHFGLLQQVTKRQGVHPQSTPL